jgi:hypothetical protein
MIRSTTAMSESTHSVDLPHKRRPHMRRGSKPRRIWHQQAKPVLLLFARPCRSARYRLFGAGAFALPFCRRSRVSFISFFNFSASLSVIGASSRVAGVSPIAGYADGLGLGVCPRASVKATRLERTNAQAVDLIMCALPQSPPPIPPGSYSINSSARTRSDSGTSRPSVLAVLRLTSKLILVGNSTGRSAGLVPLRIWLM